MPMTASNASREMVDEAAVYIGIFASRYGAVTVEELRYAQQRGIPILVFIADEMLNRDDIEGDPVRAAELGALKAELRSRYTVGLFHSPEELGTKVIRSLMALREQGVVTPVQGQGESIPRPPTPYYAYPYVAAGSAGFVGRRSELGLLDAWASSADSTLLVEAIGGSGKSALTWEWVHTHLPTVLPERAGLVWWSFYEAQASMGKFLSYTLAYLTEQPIEECAKLPRNVQEEQLLTVLRTKPVVLVLDGVERLLLAYHRHDAAQLADAVVEAEPRRCTDPRDGTLLRALSQAGPSKVLITTRLLPQDLQDRTGQLLRGVRHLPLSGLRGEDAIALLAEAGVTGDTTVMRGFLAQFGDHALLLQVLAGRIRAYRPDPGNFDAWYQAVGHDLKLNEQDLVARRASILQAALEDLDPAVFRLLAQLAAFRYAVDYDAVVAINPFRPPEENREFGLEPLNAALSTLEERGLVQWDRVHNRYDLHPVVRAYAYAQLEDKQATYAQVKSYFEALPPEDTRQAQDVADLRRTLELYHALLNAGQLGEAFQLYRDRLSTPLLSTLGAYATIVELLSPFFSQGFDQPPALRDISAQSYISNDLAGALLFLGDQSQAQRLYALQLRLRLHDRSAPGLAIGLSNLGDSLQNSGQLAAAERAYQLSLAVAQEAHLQDEIDAAHQQLTGVYARTGIWDKGEATYTALQTSLSDETRNGPFAYIQAARLRWGQGQDPTPFLAQALRSAREHRFLRAERETQRLVGAVAFARGDFTQAREACQATYAIAQREGLPLGPFLADLARLQAAQQDSEQAKALLAEALALGGLGVALAAVEVYTALGEPAEAKRYIETAYREAWADGPPYAFYHELQRIRAALKTLRMPEPQLPPFDPARVPSLPDEAEIRAFIAELARAKKVDKGEHDDEGLPALLAAPVNPSSNGKHPRWQFWRRR